MEQTLPGAACLLSSLEDGPRRAAGMFLLHTCEYIYESRWVIGTRLRADVLGITNNITLQPHFTVIVQQR